MTEPSFRPPTLNPFSPFDSSLNSRWWWYETFHEIPHVTNDKREYTHALLDYLIESGGEIVERETTVREEDGTDDDDDLHYSKTRGLTVWHHNRLIVVWDDDESFTMTIFHHPGKPPHLDEYSRYLRPLEKGSVSVLLQGTHEMYLKRTDFAPPVIDDLELNYGTGFAKAHEQIVSKLNRRSSGIIMLHGEPGSGKSFYIKYLTSLIDRDFIFIPISMVDSLSQPGFLKILMSNQEAVLVLEDAERALQSREEDFYNSSTVSTMLNLGDGLLGTVLKTTVLCTMNMAKTKVDRALLRKGRLLFDHEFTKLKVPDARRLAAHLKRDMVITEPTSLADIYNAAEDTGYTEPVQRSIGFGESIGRSTTPV